MTDNLRNAVARVASKNRRDKESVEFQELTQLLPFSPDICEKQDKESIVRLVIAYLRLHSYLQDDVAVHRRPAVTSKSTCSRGSRRQQRVAAPDATSEQSSGNVPPADDFTGGQSRDTELVQADIVTTCTATSGSPAQVSVRDSCEDSAAPWWNADDGDELLQLFNRFLVLLSRKGRVLYVSRNVEEYLGVPQVWMVGRWLAEFIHPDDVKILQQQLDLSPTSTSIGPQPEHSRGYDFKTTRDFHLRMRHFPNGAGARKKPGNFLLVRWTGQVRSRRVGRAHGLVCLCHPVQSHALLELRLGGSMFISRHDMRMTFTYCDPRVLYLIGYDPENLIGHTVYTFHNPVDLKKCTSCHNDLIQTGTGVSQCYRFLGRTGAWVWMQTKATIVTDTRQKPQYVVCNNYIISQKEGERRHKMELQQYHLPLDDLTAPGAIDLSHVTSPASSLADDDTGYSTAVSSIGSSSTSPSPQGTTPACGVDPDPLMSDGVLALGQELTDMSCAPVEEEFSSLEMTRVTEGTEAGRGQDQLLGSDLPLSITCSALPFGADVTVCGEQLTCDDADPFLYSGTAVGCGGGVMEDMELLEDLLEKIGDCDKTDCSQQDLAVPSLTPCVADVTSLEGKQVDVGKPPSLLRTLLDKEGQALAERPASSDAVITTTTSTFTYRVASGERQHSARGVKGKQAELSASTKSLAEGGRRGSLSDSDNSAECASLAALPDDLLDLAMQYCDDIPDMDSPMPDALPCLESDAWGAAMEDLIPDTPEPATLPSSSNNLVPVTDKVTSVVEVVEPTKQDLGTHTLRIGLGGKVGDDLDLIISKPQAVIQSAVVSSTQHAADKARGEGMGKRVAILPTLFTKCASTAVSVGGVVRGPAETNQTLSPVLSDHQYSTARAPSPKCGAAAACGKRACPQLNKAGVGPHTVRTQQQQQPALKIVRKSPHSAGEGETASALMSAMATSGQKQQRPTTVQVSVPVNGGGKPLTAMSELEKHLRGLVAPPLERGKDSDETDDEMWEDGRPARPFLERLLTGEMSHERYRQIDYQLLYQERERRMSETSATGHCSS